MNFGDVNILPEGVSSNKPVTWLESKFLSVLAVKPHVQGVIMVM